MPAIPANFASRKEIQTLLIKLSATISENAFLNNKVIDAMNALACLEGTLAQMHEIVRPHPNHNVLKPNGWTTRWLDEVVVLDDVPTTYQRQFLYSPNSQHVFPTANYRIISNGEPVPIRSIQDFLASLSIELGGKERLR